MNKLVLLFALFAFSSACVHNEWSHSLSCYGPDVKEFPNVTDVSHIDILNTSMTSLPDITTFPNLLSMTIEDNQFINCQEILELKKSATNILITTDCDDTDENFCHVNKKCIQLCVDILTNHVI